MSVRGVMTYLSTRVECAIDYMYMKKTTVSTSLPPFLLHH